MTSESNLIDAFTAACERSDRVFWLDGGGARAWSSRQSVLGVLEPDDLSLTLQDGVVYRHQHGSSDPVDGEIWDVLAAEMAADAKQPDVHWAGYFGYAARPDLPATRGPAGEVPDAVWMRARRPLVVRHPVQESRRLSPTFEVQTAAPPLDYRAAFERVQSALREGRSYEVNLTYREQVESEVSPAQAYLRLRQDNPAPYAGFLRHGSMSLLSSSPERFATIDRRGRLECKPIKGTTSRGRDRAEDQRLAQHLAQEPKFRAENLMIVDLLRNDVAMVSELGSVTVPELMRVESYPSVHQLVSTVRGRLRPEVNSVTALRTLFPAGSMTGAPKRETMRIIAEVESSPRGVYSGAFGWIAPDGRADLGVVIRSLVGVERAGHWRYSYGTGGGITVDSEVAAEYAETRWKSERLRRAVRGKDGAGY